MLSARLLPCVIQYVCWLFMTHFSTTCILKRSTCGFLTYYSVRSAKMGVSVSHPLRRTTKAKYIQTLDGGSSEFEETEQFFSRNLHQEHNKRETSRGNKGFSKRNEAGCLQFKGTRGNSRCPFVLRYLNAMDWTLVLVRAAKPYGPSSCNLCAEHVCHRNVL